MPYPITLFLLLVFFHVLADYPLQGDFLAKGKNHLAPITGIPWYHCLTAHAIVHAGFVGLAMNSVEFAIMEFSAHWVIDFCKSDKVFGNRPHLAYNIDQAMHIVCKLIWVILWYWYK
jgi:hypothetical protein